MIIFGRVFLFYFLYLTSIPITVLFHLMTLTASCVASVCFKVNIFVPVKVKNKMTDTKENKSWSNNVIINMLDSVPNYEECQTLCQVKIVTFIEAFDKSYINLFSRMSRNVLLGLGQAPTIQNLRFNL